VVSGELVSSFVEAHKGTNFARTLNVAVFRGFQSRIQEAIRAGVRPILANLHQQRGVIAALVVADDAVVYSTAQVDQLAVLANLQVVLTFATDMCK